ncbi:MAG TPA: arginine deiminase-related protein [Flavisolibacter sp.]
MQITDTILMVRPAHFCYNAETASSNHFQRTTALSPEALQLQAAKEFDVMVDELRRHEINVFVIDDTAMPIKPDAIFPNNWISTNRAGVVSIFPMQAQSRRLEKRADIIQNLRDNFEVTAVQDWSAHENGQQYLEGTGSMVIDHQHKVIYACLSPRTHQAVVEKFADANGYRAITFTAHDLHGKEIYHTNVMMCIGEGFAVLCPKAITDHDERVAVAQLLEATGHENIYITHGQMTSFAGNMLHIENKKGHRFVVLSQTALQSLEEEKKERLQKFGKLLPFEVSTIEQVEGGSVRCMMAEIFLKRKSASQNKVNPFNY